MGFLGILGRVPRPFPRAAERFVHAILKVGMMMPVVLAQRLFRHPKEPSRITEWRASLHQPGSRRVPQNMWDHVLPERCVASSAFPRCPNLTCQCLSVDVHHVIKLMLGIEALPSLHMSEQPRRDPCRWLTLARLTLV